jgi:plasmid replication initiation protein
LPLLIFMDIQSNDLSVEFYDCDVFDTFKDDMASMEHPIYSLSKLAEHRTLKYERNDCKIEIKTGPDGLPTVLDKDIMVYLTSSLMASKNKGEKLSQTIRFSVRDYLRVTGKSIGGSQFKQIEQGLDRLKGTTIKTNIKTNGVEITKSFGIIEGWISVKKDRQEKSIAIEIKLSDWCYNSILGNEVLTIDKDYFKLGKPTDKRLYEIARKHCGNQTSWKIKLEALKEKLGTTSAIRTLRFNIKKIAGTNHLPEYNIFFQDDLVTFTRKYPPKDPVKPAQLPVHVSKSAIAKAAKPGETEQQVRDRLTKQAEQKGIPKKAVIAESSAGKEEKRGKVKEPAGKGITKPKVVAEIQKMKAATAGNGI